MIASVRGRVAHRGTDEVVVEVGGVGMTVVVSPRTAAGVEVGQECLLTTQLVVREDSLTLYGFADAGEREVFRTVQTVSGIGPRLALTMLATMTADQIRAAIAAEDVAALVAVPGLGRKSAQRIIVDLKDKLDGPVVGGASAVSSQASWRTQVSAALTGLGWSAAEAQAAVSEVATRPDAADLPVPEALRLALQVLDHTPAVTP
ncbi:MAG: Holliday junction branch migration protein RuvA [Actinobacteria bacterium]|nr:MAG: Holliday junction branch migration protein RuvA [Actinomycetota bacterium]